MSKEEFELIDAVYRSRLVLLDLLAARGFDVDRYRKFSPAEAAAGINQSAGLGLVLTHQDDPERVCHVRYVFQGNMKKFEDDITATIESERKKQEAEDRKEADNGLAHFEIIYMLHGNITDSHHALALRTYVRSLGAVRAKLRVSFFSVYHLLLNPLMHVLVPKHEIVPETEHKSLLESMYITHKSKLPEIKYHVDPIARCIGAVPGDILRITRPSGSSGMTVIYRVCAA